MKKKNKRDYLASVRNGELLSDKEQITLIMRLSIPAIVAQLSSVIMQYIDASMVGRLGSTNVASIGLVASSTWLLGSVVSASTIGFTVQVAHLIGAKKEWEAKTVLKQSILWVAVIALLFLGIGVSLSPVLPIWLGGSKEVLKNASAYFMIYSLAIPAAGLNTLAGGMLQSTGNMKVPGFLNSAMCFLDIIFNYLLIFPNSKISFLGMVLRIPGANMGVSGAALGTALAELVTVCIMMSFLLFHSVLGIGTHVEGEGLEQKENNRVLYLRKAFKIASPVAFEHFIVCLAMIVTTRILAPLGVIAIAANSFAITAESLCYMPGYGMAQAATTLVGQSIGAKQKKSARQFARHTAYLGFCIMLFGSALMYVCAPVMIGVLTKDPKVLSLGVRILRIEAFAEPFYVVSIIVSGALRGAGDTLIPSLINFVSLWMVRIPLSYVLAKYFGLVGVWIAMCLELIFRGSVLMIRLWREKWLKDMA